MAQSAKTLEQLDDFKEHMNSVVRAYCRKNYNINTNSQFISPLIEDMLENLEAHIETIAEQSIQDEDIAYDNYHGE